MSARGFTLIELLVASAMLLGVMGLVAALSLPLRDGFERSLGAADMTSGSRTVLDRLAAEVREAGSPASVGDAPPARVVSPMMIGATESHRPTVR
jgi:prepilin-type N-terminal cleavage/methylation domain-containing protein